MFIVMQSELPSILSVSLRDKRAMTLVEVVVALTVAAMLFAGVMAGLIQSRRLTEGSVAQSSAQAAVESYMEQMKSMPIPLLVNAGAKVDANGNPIAKVDANNCVYPYIIPTQQDDATADGLKTSTGVPPDISTLKPGVTVTPGGIVDNLKDVPANPSNPGKVTTWAALWPAATNTYISTPSTNPKRNDLHLNVWVWVTDLSTPAGANDAYGITMIYSWQFWDGVGTQYFVGTLRTVRSIVPTFNPQP